VFELPGGDRESTEQRCKSRAGDREIIGRPPREIGELAKRVKRHFKGKTDTFLDVHLDQSSMSDFASKTYGVLRQLAPGSVITYGELASLMKKPRSARAVGRAMATNPMPLLIPCHRVVPSDGTYGSFSATGGASLKAKMLFGEGVVLDQEHEKGIETLRKKDPVMRRIVGDVGPYLAMLNPRANIYNSLVEAIIHQQLSMKAGRTIAGRFKDLTEGSDFPNPKEIKKIKDSRLRGAGVSKQKISYVRDLASKIESGDLSPGKLPRMSDEEVIGELTKVKGIGRWTAQMTLMFQLGRLDVLPVDDLGLGNGVQEAYGLKSKPSPKELETIGKKWKPYRSMATWYIWQSLKAGGV